MNQSVNGPGVTPKDKEKQKETKVDVRGRPLTVGRMSCTKKDWYMDRASTKAYMQKPTKGEAQNLMSKSTKHHPTKELRHWCISKT